MVAWNIKLFLVALTPTSAFFVPSVLQQHRYYSAMRSSPDSWLGSSPSDHYGGAVGPEFEKMEGVDRKPTPTIRPLDWNGGTMEAGFSQQLEEQRQLEYDAGGKSFFPEKAQEEETSSTAAPVVAQEEETAPESEPTGQVAFEIRNEVGQRLGYATPSEEWEKEGSRSGDTISPLEWSGGTMEDGFKRAQKKRPSRYLQAPFESKEVTPTRDYATLKQATPAGKPKTIADETPNLEEPPSTPAAPQQEDPQAEQMSSVKFDDGTSEATIYEKQKKYIPSGHYEHAFENKQLKPQQDWRTLQQATPEGQPKMIGLEAPKKQAEAPKKKPKKGPEAVEWTEQQMKDYGPPQEGFPVRPFKSEPDQFGDWFETVAQVEQDPEVVGKKKWIPSGHHEHAYQTQEVKKPKQDWTTLEQATPEGQPKMIGVEAPKKKVQTTKKSNEPKAAGGVGPPREGFPVRPFKSEPDQFGDWFSHVDD